MTTTIIVPELDIEGINRRIQKLDAPQESPSSTLPTN